MVQKDSVSGERYNTRPSAAELREVRERKNKTKPTAQRNYQTNAKAAVSRVTKNQAKSYFNRNNGQWTQDSNKVVAFFVVTFVILFCTIVYNINVGESLNTNILTQMDVENPAHRYEIFKSGEPYLILCASSTKTTVPKIVTSAATTLAERGWAQSAILDCDARFPSGKSVYERFDLTKSKKSKKWTLFAIANGKKPLQLRNIKTPGKLVQATKQYAHKKFLSATSTADLNSMCLKRTSCVLLMKDKAAMTDVEQRAWKHVMLRHRKVAFVTLNGTKYHLTDIIKQPADNDDEQPLENQLMVFHHDKDENQLMMVKRVYDARDNEMMHEDQKDIVPEFLTQVWNSGADVEHGRVLTDWPEVRDKRHSRHGNKRRVVGDDPTSDDDTEDTKTKGQDDVIWGNEHMGGALTLDDVEEDEGEEVELEDE